MDESTMEASLILSSQTGDSISWQIDDHPAWLDVDPIRGVVATRQNLMITVDESTLSYGSQHHGTIDIHWNGETSSISISKAVSHYRIAKSDTLGGSWGLTLLDLPGVDNTLMFSDALNSTDPDGPSQWVYFRADDQSDSADWEFAPTTAREALKAPDASETTFYDPSTVESAPSGARSWRSSAVELGVNEVLLARPIAHPTSMYAVVITNLREVEEGEDEIVVQVAEFMQ
jgi:hypothetical protein